MIKIKNFQNKCAKITFVIPVYGESIYLEECIESLKLQSVQSEIIISTSTSNKFIQDISKKFQISLHINQDGGMISKDWNFALSIADSELVVIAHQDDIYVNSYAEQVINFYEKNKELGIIFTDSIELVNSDLKINVNRERVKNILRMGAFMGRDKINKPFNYKILLAFGCPIPCPSVAYIRRNLTSFRFSDELKINLDWNAWLELAKKNIAIGYIRKKLVIHRLHLESETMKGIIAFDREREDLLMFKKIWPQKIAKLLSKIYKLGY